MRRAVPGASPVYVILAAAIFVAEWSFLSNVWPVSIEEVSVYPAPAGRVAKSVPLEIPPTLAFEDGCYGVKGVAIRSSQVRPLVSLCWNGRRFPILISSYASGIPYWISEVFRPLYRDNVFRLRASGLVLGLLAIVFAWRLVRIYAGLAQANAAALCIACTPPFVLMHSTLIHFEILPWLLCTVALDQLSRCEALRPRSTPGAAAVPSGRLFFAAALLGVAIIANIKALIILLPLGVIAVRAGVRWRAVSYRQLAGCAAILLVTALPTVLANTLHTHENFSGDSFSGQIDMRLAILFERFSLQRLIAETQNLLLFWSDLFSLAASKPGDSAPPAQPGMLIALPALAYCTACAAAFMVRGSGQIVAAACGALLLSSIAVAAMFYGQYPAGNHTPIAAVFGIASAVTAIRAADWLAAHSSISLATSRTVSVAIASACLLWGMFVHGNPARYATVSFNAHALQHFAEYFESASAPDTPLVVTTYNLAGVPEAVTGGRAHGIQAHVFLSCTGRHGEPSRSCLESRLDLLVRANPASIRFLIPGAVSYVDERYAALLAPALTSVVERAGRPIAVEASFRGLDTEPLLKLIRIGPAPKEGEPQPSG